MGYNELSLDEIFDSISIKHKFDKEELIFLNTSDILDGEILHNDYSEVCNFPGQAKKSIQKNDILYSEIRPKNKRYALVDFEADDFVVSTKLMVLRIKEKYKEKVKLQFIYQYITSKPFIDKLQMIAESRSGTFPQITFSEFGRLKIKLPDLKKQVLIADMIEKINNKIQLNRSTVFKLDELSSLLFKRYFTEFEFPNEQGLPYRSSYGEMVESELGEIPKGWSVELLSTVSDFLSGGTPKTKEESYWNGDIPFFTPKDVGSSIYCNGTEKTITELGLSKCNSRLYPKNTIFITARGTVGKIALANKDMAMNQSCFALKHKQDKQFYLLGVISNLLREIVQGANGAVFNAINLGDLNRLKFVSPPQELVGKYNDLVTPFYNQMSELEIENIKLRELRDSLLTKLLSGEIEIPDESVVEAK